jgi:hypothetical protein
MSGPSPEKINSLIRQITGLRFDRVDGAAAERVDRGAAELSLKSMLEALPAIEVEDDTHHEDERDGIKSQTQLKVIDKAIVKGSGIYRDQTDRIVDRCSVFIYLFDPEEYHDHIGIDDDVMIFIEEFKCGNVTYGKKLLYKVLKYIKDNLRNKHGREFQYVAFLPQENLRDIGAKFHTYRTRAPGTTDIDGITRHNFGYGYLDEIMRACVHGVRKRSPQFSSDEEEDYSSLFFPPDAEAPLDDAPPDAAKAIATASEGGKKNHTNKKYTMKMRKNKKSKKRWSLKYKRSINCKRPRGFSQRQYCKYGRKKNLK